MSVLEKIYAALPNYLPLIIITTVVLVSLRLIQWLWLSKRLNAFSDRKIIPQLLMLAFSIAGIILIVLSLPISDTLRAQMLSLMGLLMTGVMALSSTTFVANAFAGSMLRLTRSFRTGDYIRVNNQGGRVSERGIFHTEIQTEDSDLTTFPNMYLITNPVTVVRKLGTIVSAKISLGYDVDHAHVEKLLVTAAQSVELEDPYVHILDLGDFSVTYKVSGFLSDIKILLTTRSKLKAAVLDGLHAANVEIVSPTFMNQRVQENGTVFIPQKAKRTTVDNPDKKIAEEIVFDKAEGAEVAEAEAEALKEVNDLSKTDETIK